MKCTFADDGLCGRVTNVVRCNGIEEDMSQCPEWAAEFAARELYNKLEDIRIAVASELEAIRYGVEHLG